MSLWVVGGSSRTLFGDQPEWTKYQSALVLRVEDDGLTKSLEYESPPEHGPDGQASHIFKAATIVGETAYLCTQTEVLECGFPNFKIRQVISLPCFNDLHHVVVGPDGNLFVAVTGLDAVAEISPDGELLRLTDVRGGNVWDNFSQDVDYRKVPTTKPHASHPNYVFFLDGQPWVTRLHQRDAVCVRDTRKRIPIHDNPVHDGHVHADRTLFTSVDGHIIEYSHSSGARRVFDLNSLNDNPTRPLGWCRGLLMTKAGLWVGFSRIRYTRFKQNLSWIRHGFCEHAPQPTRISLYELDPLRLIKEHVVESGELNAVFSIHGTADKQVPTMAPCNALSAEQCFVLHDVPVAAR